MTLNGTRGAYAQPGRYGRTDAGAFADKAWEGTSNEIVSEALAAEASGALWTVNESYTGAKYRLEAHFPIDFNTTESPVDIWELFAEEAEKNFLDAGIPEIDALPDDERKYLNSILQNGIDSNVAMPALSDTALELYDLISFGVQSVIVPAPHFRHTQTISNNYSTRNTLTNVKKLYSTSTMRTTEEIPSILILPDDTSTRLGFNYGWFKKFPTVRACAGHKTQIEQEYQYGLWPQLLYGAPL